MTHVSQFSAAATDRRRLKIRASSPPPHFCELQVDGGNIILPLSISPLHVVSQRVGQG
jgi:hypothetical protein